jgi:hypothetical protein
LSLPGLLRTTVATIPAEIPYLSADAERVKAWQARLDRLAGFKVGVVWQGNPKHVADRRRSLRLSCFGPLAQVPDIRLISLQKGFGVEQLRSVPFAVIAPAGTHPSPLPM